MSSPGRIAVALFVWAMAYGSARLQEREWTTHPLKGTFNTAGVGVDLVRRYELAAGDRLMLTPVDNSPVHSREALEVS
jgi:hypothetical protein